MESGGAANGNFFSGTKKMKKFFCGKNRINTQCH